MFLNRLFGPGSATRLVDLDGLATLELLTSFHLDDTRELQLLPARRLRRQPYLQPAASANQLTYYLPSHDSYGFGGRKVPVLLRVTLYADDVPLAEAPDQAYFHAIARQGYYHDGTQEAAYARAAPAGEGLYFTEEPETAPGLLSTKSYHTLHLILTDPAKRARLFLSADDRELSRREAEKLLRQVLHSLQPEPAALAQHFEYLRHFLQHEAAIKAANVQANLLSFNQQLAGAKLPLLRPVALYEPGRFVDVGDYFYGVNEQQGVLFIARLGTSTLAKPTTPTYFTSTNPDGRYITSFSQQAILQQDVPAGHELCQRTGVSEPLWFPPEEFATFHLADLLRESDASRALVRQQPGFAAVPHREATYWDLSRVERDETRATFGQAADYRFAGVRLEAVTRPDFTLHYLGIRTAAGQPPQLAFALETLDDSPRSRPVADNTQYHTVAASQGGQLDLTVAGAHYRVHIKPPAQGHLVVEPLSQK
ncbi:hypothetical protein [Hymenobacter negativus]|uniref:Uncharacterized protein n=1 Tax=Hymenobacter negativus TaxID=2795026 RepID=A0ABS3Q8T9_9BACT|nr:hypothetical protein [Hymenobacter negativus]MBO2007622.1 hypothetical protein [Hymenobacter negativus]